MKAIKDNREYDITENEKASYLARGFDICDDSGNVVEHSPQSVVLYSTYEKVVNENTELKARLTELEKSAEKSSKKEKGNVSES